MATDTLTPGKGERYTLVLDASGEIEASVDMLLRERQSNADAPSFSLILRTTLLRIHELNSVSLSVLGGDDGRATNEMHEVVYGA